MNSGTFSNSNQTNNNSSKKVSMNREINNQFTPDYNYSGKKVSMNNGMYNNSMYDYRRKKS